MSIYTASKYLVDELLEHPSRLGVRPSAPHVLAMVLSAGLDLGRPEYTIFAATFISTVRNPDTDAIESRLGCSVAHALSRLKQSSNCHPASDQPAISCPRCTNHLLSTLLVSFSSPNAGPELGKELGRGIGHSVPTGLAEALEDHGYWEESMPSYSVPE